jgi:glycosyltransferase involved in cell wall biosynthesis
MDETPLAARPLEVVIPVHNGAELLSDCLASVIPQLGPGDRITVVDDGSSDASAEIAAQAGARVLRTDTAQGPYLARQSAAMSSQAFGLIFFDMRSRALPGWLETHRTLLSEPGVALSATDVRVLSGNSVAERIAALQQPYRLAIYTDGQRDPYFPTCNLGVRTEAFTAVDGFTDVRSGGDADLCWRIQRAGLGRLAARDEVLVLWQPRSSLRAAFEQAYRFGRGHRALMRASGRALPAEPVRKAVRARRYGYLLGLLRSGTRVRDLALLGVLRAVFWIGVLRGPSGPGSAG